MNFATCVSYRRLSVVVDSRRPDRSSDCLSISRSAIAGLVARPRTARRTRSNSACGAVTPALDRQATCPSGRTNTAPPEAIRYSCDQVPFSSPKSPSSPTALSGKPSSRDAFTAASRHPRPEAPAMSVNAESIRSIVEIRSPSRCSQTCGARLEKNFERDVCLPTCDTESLLNAIFELRTTN